MHEIYWCDIKSQKHASPKKKKLQRTLHLFRCKIFSNVKYFIEKYLQVFGKCCDLNIANINRPPPATTYPTTPNHCKNIHCNPISFVTIIYPNTQESSESPPTIQNIAIKTTTSHHQSFKKLPPTTKTTTTNHLLSHSIGHHHLPKHPRAIRITTNLSKHSH